MTLMSKYCRTAHRDNAPTRAISYSTLAPAPVASSLDRCPCACSHQTAEDVLAISPVNSFSFSILGFRVSFTLASESANGQHLGSHTSRYCDNERLTFARSIQSWYLLKLRLAHRNQTRRSRIIRSPPWCTARFRER